MVKTTVSTRLHPEVHKLLKEQAHAEWRTPSAVLQDIVHDYYALRLDEPEVLEGYKARMRAEAPRVRTANGSGKEAV